MGHVARTVCSAAGVALTAACSVAGAATPESASADLTTPAPRAELAAINSFRVTADRRQRPVRGADGALLVSWEVVWRLSWADVPGATGYAVYYGTNEGPGDRPRTVQAEPTVAVHAAAGTSPRRRLGADQRAALVLTSSQLLVAVAPRGAGRSGPRSPWFPVGDVPPDGVPLGSARLGGG